MRVELVDDEDEDAMGICVERLFDDLDEGTRKRKQTERLQLPTWFHSSGIDDRACRRPDDLYRRRRGCLLHFARNAVHLAAGSTDADRRAGYCDRLCRRVFCRDLLVTNNDRR